MYSRWIEKQKCKFNIISEHKGDEVGIKSSILKITGPYMYGWLKSESGVHRLVRISPFDSGARRHTSFASVWVYPVVDDSIKIDIQDKDIRVDTYKSSGKGGQSVNTTDSAVRITHLPTNIVVQCQNERSQLQNKLQAMEILKSKLWDLELQKQKSEISEARKSQVGSGERSEKIRTYNLPQGRVTDHRLKLTSHNLTECMNGLIDEIIDPLMKDEQAKKLISQKN